MCHLQMTQEFDIWVTGGAVISVAGEEQCGAHTSLWGTCSDCPFTGCEFSQPQLLFLVSQEVYNPLTGGGRHSELDECCPENFRSLNHDGKF